MIIQQMKGAGSRRQTRWPKAIYALCAARQFAVRDGESPENFVCGVTCAYTGVFVSTSREIPIGLPTKNLRTDYRGELDHVDPNSFTWDNTPINLQFLSAWINGENFKFDRIAPYTIYSRARLGVVNEWPYIADLLRKTFEYDGVLLVGWPLGLTNALGAPFFPGYDERKKTFKSPVECITEEHSHYEPNVRNFLAYCERDDVRADVKRVWNEMFGRYMDIR